MHLCFVPLTEDGRLSAKEIVGNKKKLTQRQDEFWKHMVKNIPIWSAARAQVKPDVTTSRRDCSRRRSI